MLDDVRTVSWRVAATLVVGGAISAVLILALITSGSSRAGVGHSSRGSTAHRPQARQVQPAARPRRHRRPPTHPVPDLARLVGQRFMVALRGNVPSPALLEDARRGMIGGVLLFPSSSEPSQAGVAAATLQLAAQEGGNPPLLIATDQEGGAVKRFPEGPPAGALSTMSPNQALREGRETASFLLRRSIDVDLAPVVDLGLPDSFIEQQGRTISSHPNTVANVANAFAAGLRQLHVLPVAKHFPGLGMATVNSDEARSVVSGSLSSSLFPFRSMIGQGAPAIMVSTAIYTSIDSQHGAAWSPRIVQGLLRRRLGFRGLVFSDDLATAGVNASLDASAAVVQAAQAGVDILMIGDANAFRPAYRAALSAARHAQLSLPNLEQSQRRILRFKREYGG